MTNVRILFTAAVFSLGGIFSASEVDSIPYAGAEHGPVTINYQGGKNYSYIERTDLRRYDNGKYQGLTSREVRSFIIISQEDENGILYDGSFYVDEGTKRANVEVFEGISDSIPSTFRISPDGNLEMIEDNGYPSFRSFPTYPKKEIKPGDKWQSKALRCVDPLNKGIVTKIPFYVEYTYLRDEVYAGEEVFVLSAKWATRYGAKFYLDFNGDRDLLEVTGSNNATLYVSKVTGAAIVIRDSVDELYTFADGQKVNLKGTINLFTKYPPSYDVEQVLPELQQVAGFTENQVLDIKSGIQISGDIVNVEKTDAGLRLTIPNLQFKSDSAELLPAEKERLDSIARILKKAGDSKLLIEGHTASTGNEAGELELSKERAKMIALELSKRGINSDRFIIKGSGSHKPIADNSTKEGMALNRRVEITILK